MACKHACLTGDESLFLFATYLTKRLLESWLTCFSIIGYLSLWNGIPGLYVKTMSLIPIGVFGISSLQTESHYCRVENEIPNFRINPSKRTSDVSIVYFNWLVNLFGLSLFCLFISCFNSIFVEIYVLFLWVNHFNFIFVVIYILYTCI